MAKIFEIKDGITTIDLNSSTGFSILIEQWFPKTPQDDDNLHETVLEDMGVILQATSIDNMGAQMQGLKKMFRKAREYHETNWQTTPVYLKIQADGEQEVSYALVHSGQLNEPQTRLADTVTNTNKMVGIQLLIEREHWTDKIPGAYPSAETLTRINDKRPASPTRVHIGNTNDTVTVPDYIFNNELGGAGFSANHSGSSSFNLFRDSGNVQATDIVWLGFNNPGHNIVLDLLFSANVSIAESYAYGSGLSAATIANGKLKSYPNGGSVFVDDTSDNVKVIGLQAADWDKSTINGQETYWIAITADTINTAGTITVQNNQPYCPNVNYMRIPDTVTDGDLAPYLHLSFANGAGDDVPAFSTPSRIVMGLNSQNVTLYDSLIPAQDISPNAANWSYSLLIDATNVDSVSGPGGKAVNVDFSTDATLVQRFRIFGNANNVDAAYYGKFRAFLLCEQVGGEDGDTSVQLEIFITDDVTNPTGHFLTQEVDLQTQDAGAEVVDLGIIDIPGVEFVANDDIDNNAIFFRPFAARSTGSSTLNIYAIVLMRANEWLGVLNSPIITTSSKASSLNVDIALEMDSGVVRKRVMRAFNSDNFTTLANSQPAGSWELHGDFPKMLPATEYYMHFLIMRYAGAAFGTGPWIADVGSHLVAEVRVTDRYGTIKGAD